MAQSIPRASADKQREILTHAVIAAAESLGLNGATMAQALGISPASVSRMRNGHHQLGPDKKEWELAVLLIRLYRGLDAICGGDAKVVRAWMANWNNDLQGIPKELITRVIGLTHAVDYVDSYRARV